MISTLFFDFDGVILESVEAKTRAFAELFRDYPEHIDAIVRYHVENTGVSRFDKFRHYYANIIKEELTDERFQELCDNFSKLALKNVLNSPFVSGTKEFLERYSREFDCYIVSATPHDEMKYIVEQLELSKYFKQVCGSPRNKGQWVADIMTERNINSEEAVFIGDSRSDYWAAVENNISFIARIIKGKPSCFDGFDLPYTIHDFNGFEAVLLRLQLNN